MLPSCISSTRILTKYTRNVKDNYSKAGIRTPFSNCHSPFRPNDTISPKSNRKINSI